MAKRTAKRLEYDRRYRERHRERVRANNLRWFHENVTAEDRENQQQYQLLMRLAFPEKMSAINRKSQAKNRAKRNAYTRQWFKDCPPGYHLALRRANPERYRAIARRHRQKHKAHRKQYHAAYCRRRKCTDLNFKLLCTLRSRLSEEMKKNRRCAGTENLLGCSITSFRLYLESKFEPGMTWENYGRTGWHIDHIMPCAIFDLTKPEHQRRCFHFSNMQPMWAIENIKKGHKLPEGVSWAG